MSNIAELISGRPWYHTIELPGGVVTPGMFDTRRAAAKIPLPSSLEGKRCLDVGTNDGFWAFEMERRGAREVVAIDLVDQTQRDVRVGSKESVSEGESIQSRNFTLVHEMLGSKVEFRNLSVYDLDPADIGTFDFVFMGSILLHLRDPVEALTAVRSVTGGELLSFDAISPLMTLMHPRTPAARLMAQDRVEWWTPNIAALRRMIRAAGFDIAASGGVTFIAWRGAKPRRIPRHPLTMALLLLAGVPQSWVIARPRPA